jgi:capsular polysaccharide biosynthesis protein
VLERSSIYYQYRVFRDAKVIIAQHGASLSNIFFMKAKESHVIEFSPPWSREAEHFKNLAHYVGVGHHSISQEEDHSEISISAVIALLHQIYVST